MVHFLWGCLFQFSTLFWISFREIKKTGWSQKREAEKLMERCFELLAFGAIQFLTFSKANKQNNEKLETNTP
jgi:hypothetical protein